MYIENKAHGKVIAKEWNLEPIDFREKIAKKGKCEKKRPFERD